jgi:transcriptional regulator with XRE-family HTH domain
MLFPNIEAERARKGYTKSELAKRLNVSDSTLKNWMYGKTEIPSSKIVELAKLFGTSTDYLLGLTGDIRKS